MLPRKIKYAPVKRVVARTLVIVFSVYSPLSLLSIEIPAYDLIPDGRRTAVRHTGSFYRVGWWRAGGRVVSQAGFSVSDTTRTQA
jgi:hypothetical protein